MGEECVLCGRYVELDPDWEIGMLEHVTDEDKGGFVCYECLNSRKLNFGDPIGGCLFCDNGADYRLTMHNVRMSSSGPVISSNLPRKPILCDEHFQELKEEDQDHTLSIDEVLEEEEEDTVQLDVSVPELIGDGENKHLEYKETFVYDVHRDQANTDLKEEVAQEVCAFANSQGGVVIIGVEDDTKAIMGLERDYKMIDSRDDFELQLNQELRDRLGDTFTSRHVSVEFNEIDGKDLCSVWVEQSPEPIFFDDEEFYVRNGSSSTPLDMREAFQYREEHWK